MEPISLNSSLVRSSIFDTVDSTEMDESSIQNSPSCKKAVMWTRRSQNELIKIHHILSSVKLHESILIKKSRKHKQLKERFFVLYKDRIELYEVKKKEEVFICKNIFRMKAKLKLDQACF